MGNDAAELAELRRRAYGPNPDISDDPLALARLEQLSRPKDRVPTANASAMHDAEPVNVELTTTVRARLTPRVLLLWVASLVAGVAVAIVTTLLLTPRPPVPDAVLAQVPLEEPLANTMPGMGVVHAQFEPFHGVVPLLTDLDGGPCLVLTSNTNVTYGMFGGSCTGPGLQPVADIRLWEGMAAPPEILELLRDERVVRFTLVGDTVEVTMSDLREE